MQYKCVFYFYCESHTFIAALMSSSWMMKVGMASEFTMPMPGAIMANWRLSVLGRSQSLAFCHSTCSLLGWLSPWASHDSSGFRSFIRHQVNESLQVDNSIHISHGSHWKMSTVAINLPSNERAGVRRIELSAELNTKAFSQGLSALHRAIWRRWICQ